MTKLKIKCWMKMKSGRVERRKYKSVDGERFNGPGGIYDGPDATRGEILHYRNLIGMDVYVAYYHEGVTNPIPLNNPQKPEADSWNPADMENNLGEFIPSLIREALRENEKLQIFTVISLILAGISLLVTCLTAYWVREIVNYIGH